MPDDNAFRFDWYPARAYTKFMSLPADEIAVLIQIINLIYMNNGAIANDGKYIAQSIYDMGTAKCNRIIKNLIEKNQIYLTPDGKIAQKMSQIQLEKVKNRREEKAASGKLGGEQKAKNQTAKNQVLDKFQGSFEQNPDEICPNLGQNFSKTQDENKENQTLNSSTLLSTSSSTNISISNKKDINPHTPKILDQEFEDFWAGWIPFDMPKGSKADAKKYYTQARKEINHENLIRKRDEYLGQCRAMRTKTAHASSWLNPKRRRGYSDDYEAEPAQQLSFDNRESPDSGLRNRVNATARIIDDLCGD